MQKKSNTLDFLSNLFHQKSFFIALAYKYGGSDLSLLGQEIQCWPFHRVINRQLILNVFRYHILQPVLLIHDKLKKCQMSRDFQEAQVFFYFSNDNNPLCMENHFVTLWQILAKC